MMDGGAIVLLAAMILIIVAVDLLFLRGNFRGRLITNTVIVLVTGVLYFYYTRWPG